MKICKDCKDFSFTDYPYKGYCKLHDKETLRTGVCFDWTLRSKPHIQDYTE